MNLQEYRSALHEDISLAASADMTTQEDEFLTRITEILSSADEFDDFVECYHEGISKRKGNIRIDGYSKDDTDNTCCIFISDYRGPHGDDAIRNEEINVLFKKVRLFVEEAVKNEMYKGLEESTEVYEFAQYLCNEIDNITKFRFYLLTDAINKQRKKNIKDSEVAGKPVELNVWDITRIFDVVNSTTQKESIEIHLADFDSIGIPCVKAVEYHDVLADIEVAPKYAEDITGVISQVEEKPENIITYSSYLAVVPGEILNKLYLEYGSRLLEGNVRSFLSVRGKVNKSIQNTIKNYPEMFFAYNNGIAATASEIDTKMTDNGMVITKIKDLQIVNGGQTTASITNTILSARKDDNINIDNLYVPMKVSVLEHSMSEKIIPKISEYSNSQNKVDASDFFSNHPFHIRIEDYSRKTPAPAVNGNQYQQYWYYERTRGQYNQGKMKFKPKSSQMKQYETRYPENQVIKMVDLAKYMELYDGSPDIVSRGKQALVKVFSDKVKKQWTKSDQEFNVYYFKRVVALAILFRKTDEIIKTTNWYKLKHSYKANIIAYTMSIIFNFIRTKAKGYELDFLKIWNQQNIYPELEAQIQSLSEEVYNFITDDDRLTENVTQWCKQAVCWERAQKYEWKFLDKFVKTLVSQNVIESEEKEAKESRKVDNEIDALKFILSKGVPYWQQVLEWGKKRRLLSDMELSILNIIISAKKIPSVKQAKVIIKMRERLKSDGMPMEF